MKHNLNICVSKEPRREVSRLFLGEKLLREKLLTRLFGKQEKVMILIPGNTVKSLSITELSEGGGVIE